MKDWFLDYGNHQDQGSRGEQQDYFASFNPSMSVVDEELGFLAVITDGMGGHSGGATASVVAVETLLTAYQKKGREESIPEALYRSLEEANAAVVAANQQVGAHSNMGTTLIACVLQEDRLYWVSVGDSSLMLYRNGNLVSLNTMHSYGALLDAQAEAGYITKEEAQAEPHSRRKLTSYVGLDHIPKIDAPAVPLILQPDESVLLCTDGLIDALSNEEISQCLSTEQAAQQKCEILIHEALKKKIVNQDNMTAVLLEIKKICKTQNVEVVNKSKNKKVYYVFSSIAIGVIIVSSVFFSFKNNIFSKNLDHASKNKFNFESQKDAEKIQRETQKISITEKKDVNDKDSQKVYSSDISENPTCENHTKEIQIYLNKKEWYKGEFDGKIGTQTREAIGKFQEFIKIKQTKDLDQDTCRHLIQEITPK
jgi:serine/threonine protein phosphatase PrpC